MFNGPTYQYKNDWSVILKQFHCLVSFDLYLNEYPFIRFTNCTLNLSHSGYEDKTLCCSPELLRFLLDLDANTAVIDCTPSRINRLDHSLKQLWEDNISKEQLCLERNTPYQEDGGEVV